MQQVEIDVAPDATVTHLHGCRLANTVGARCLMLPGEPRAGRATVGITPLPPNYSWPGHFPPAKVALHNKIH